MTKDEAEWFAVQKMIDANLDIETIFTTMVALAMNGNQLVREKVMEVFKAHREFAHQGRSGHDYVTIRDGKIVWIAVPIDVPGAKSKDFYKE